MKVQKKERLVWLDWMKVWAILSIIWGHFFSTGHVYLYVFSVQVFCVISGFLYKKAPDWRSCLQKCFWQLFVPTIILSIWINYRLYIGTFDNLCNPSVYKEVSCTTRAYTHLAHTDICLWNGDDIP